MAELLEDRAEYRPASPDAPPAQRLLRPAEEAEGAPRSLFETKLLREWKLARVFIRASRNSRNSSLVSCLLRSRITLKLSAWPAYAEREDRERSLSTLSTSLFPSSERPLPWLSRPRPYLHPTHFIGPSQQSLTYFTEHKKDLCAPLPLSFSVLGDVHQNRRAGEFLAGHNMIKCTGPVCSQRHKRKSVWTQ